MFGMRKQPKTEVQNLSDGVKSKISELQLAILSGNLSPKGLELARQEIEKLKGAIQTRMLRVASHGTQ